MNQCKGKCIIPQYEIGLYMSIFVWLLLFFYVFKIKFKMAQLLKFFNKQMLSFSYLVIDINSEIVIISMMSIVLKNGPQLIKITALISLVGSIMYFLKVIAYLDYSHVSTLEKYVCLFSQMLVIIISFIDIGLTFRIVIIATFLSPFLHYHYILTHKKSM